MKKRGKYLCVQYQRKREDIKKWNGSHNSSSITLRLFYIGGAIFFAAVLLEGGINNDPSVLTTLVIFVSLLFLVASGVNVIMLREAPRPGLSHIKGIGAILTGVVVILVFGCASVVLLGTIMGKISGR